MNAHTFLKPVAEPQILECAFSEDQRSRLFDVLRREGPWSMILAQEFSSPAEVIATSSGVIPDGFVPTWDMFLSPVFRATLGRGYASMYPEIEDCFYNSKFLELARGYWGAKYAAPNLMLQYPRAFRRWWAAACRWRRLSRRDHSEHPVLADRADDEIRIVPQVAGQEGASADLVL